MSKYVLEEDRIWKWQACCRKFFTKTGLEIDSENKHNNMTIPEKDQEKESKEMVRNKLSTLKSDTVEGTDTALSKWAQKSLKMQTK